MSRLPGLEARPDGLLVWHRASPGALLEKLPSAYEQQRTEVELPGCEAGCASGGGGTTPAEVFERRSAVRATAAIASR
jgi:hypothetical protein